MASMDIEIQDQSVPCTVVDATELEKNQTPGEMPKPILKESGGSGDVDGQANGHGQKGDAGVVNHSERRTRTRVQFATPPAVTQTETGDGSPKKRNTWLLDNSQGREVDVAGTPEEQQMFLRELETFHRENFLEYKPLKFYGQPLNSLKLWRSVVNLGGYDVVTTTKLWRQVGESFHPPKTCTTVSYTFRNFYEKALLEFEKYLRRNGDIELPGSTDMSSSVDKEVVSNQGSGSGRARRDSAARAMQGWSAQRQAGSGEDKSLTFTPKQKKLKNIGDQKPNTQASVDPAVPKEEEQSSVADVVDDGPLADWVKITVKETKEAFEVFALIPGLLRDEVRIQSDPAGKLIITGQPEQLDNPWGITPFKKIVGLSARINPLQTNAIMSMHGRLFIRVPYEK